MSENAFAIQLDYRGKPGCFCLRSFETLDNKEEKEKPENEFAR